MNIKIINIKQWVRALILLFAAVIVPASAFANSAGGAKLKTSQVCMMNNKYFENEQIPVSANGKNYYGCCAGCAASLQANTNNIRYARDPYSGEEVDKAEAFIALKSPATKEVLYFKSEENYKHNWQGTFNNEPLTDGTYIYIIHFANESQTPLKGALEIVRNIQK
jgi:hypothetical protein